MTFDVAVVGAGIVGLAVARRVARAGARVVVLDRDENRRHASWAAAGMLAPQAEADGPGDFFSLLLRARSVYPTLVRELEVETGIDVGYRTEGMLLLALTDEDEERLDARLAWQRSADLGVERLARDQVLAREPIVNPAVRWALHFPGDHQVDNRRLQSALEDSATRAGAEFRLGAQVRAIRDEGGSFSLDLGTPDSVRAATVVLAAGAWSGAIEGLPRRIPTEPVHGQLIRVDAPAPFPRHVIASPRGYLVPRDGGRVIVGATAERVGFRDGVTLAGLGRLSSLAMDIAPSLGERPVVSHWAGLRPGTPDLLPILGPDPDLPRLLYATGHYRNGILLGPLTGEIIGDLALGKSPSLDLAPYRPDRFES